MNWRLWRSTARKKRTPLTKSNGRSPNPPPRSCFNHRVGEQFDAIVTGASDKGTWVRLLDIPVEGKLVRGFQGIDVGDRVRVELMDTDVERGYIDFGRVGASMRRC